MRRFWSRAALAVVLLATTAGCGVRLATPAPTGPSPGTVEQVRARTVADALDLVSRAEALAAAAPAPPLAGVLADVVAQSTAHVAALGGVYRSGLPSPTTTTTTSPAPTSPAGPADLLAVLASDTARAAADTDALSDARLARLVGSVAAARGELTARLAVALGSPAPPTDPTPGPSPSAAASGAPTAAASSGGPSPTAGAGSALPVDVVSALVLAHDQAGYGLEVIAAQLGADRRTATLGAARTHREQAETWARTAGISGAAADPRRAQYALPPGLSDPATAAQVGARLEQAVADAYGAAIAAAPAGARASLLVGVRRATAAARDWGAAPQAFPGIAITPGGPTPSASTTP